MKNIFCNCKTGFEVVKQLLHTVLQVSCAIMCKTCLMPAKHVLQVMSPKQVLHLQNMFTLIKQVLNFVCKKTDAWLQNRFYECKICFAVIKQVLQAQNRFADPTTGFMCKKAQNMFTPAKYVLQTVLHE